ncbi:MAG: amidohydrolase, partial [Bacteroidetes bacterium HGW-Bacteroidetes-3]
MNKVTLLFAFTFIFFSCDNKQQVDILVINANIYTVNNQFEVAESFAITNGKIVEVGTTEAIQKKYKATKNYDFSGKTIVPGFIDAHAHFYGLGLNQNVIDLVGAESFDEVVSRIVAFQKEKQHDFIEGRGWN